MIQWTKGIFADYPAQVFVDGQKDDEWQKIDEFREKYEHPLWKANGEMARKTGGHGGMDYMMNPRLMDCIKRGLAPDIDVYDAAANSAQREVGGGEWDFAEVPRFHARALEGARRCRVRC